MTMEHVVTHDIGGRLRHAREQRGLSLHDVARRTKLAIPVVRAIERNDFTVLPGGMFRKAYVRTLAGEVGLNQNDIAADYCAWFEAPIEPPSVPNRDATGPEKWVKQLTPSPRRFLVTLVLATLAIAWFLLQSALRSEVPNTYPATASGAVGLPPAAPGAVIADRSRDAATPTAIAAQTTHAPLRIELAAIGWCWVAAETDGERSMYRLMEPGERVVLEGHHLISLRLGDAGAVTLSINDGPRRSPGVDGAVAVLEVTPDNVEGLRGVAAAIVSGD